MRVWVTRDETPDGPLGAALREAGLVPVLEPVITRRVVDGALADLARLGPDDWLVLTSPYAIDAVPAGAGGTPRVAVVGEPSRRRAEARGMRVELVGGGGAAALFRELASRAAGTTVLYPRSSLAAVPEMPEGVTLLCPVLYETAPRAFRPGVVAEVEVCAVASPSAVRSVGPVPVPFASLGATTTAALRDIGIAPWVEAPEPTFPALAAAIASRGRGAAEAP
jgi:uroporphyrinogen-III synthase